MHKPRDILWMTLTKWKPWEGQRSPDRDILYFDPVLIMYCSDYLKVDMNWYGGTLGSSFYLQNQIHPFLMYVNSYQSQSPDRDIEALRGTLKSADPKPWEGHTFKAENPLEELKVQLVKWYDWTQGHLEFIILPPEPNSSISNVCKLLPNPKPWQGHRSPEKGKTILQWWAISCKIFPVWHTFLWILHIHFPGRGLHT